MNNVKFKRPVVLGNNKGRKWDGKRRRSQFSDFDAQKITFEAALRECRWASVLVLGEELLAVDVSDFGVSEVEFVNLALPRIRHYISKAVDVIHNRPDNGA
jgi:hypothetical protein